MVFLGNNVFYTDVSKSYKISSCNLLYVFSCILPRLLHASDAVYIFELMIYAKKLERACPKGHDPCGGTSTLIARHRTSDWRKDMVIRLTGISHVCLPFTAVSFNGPSACTSLWTNVSGGHVSPPFHGHFMAIHGDVTLGLLHDGAWLLFNMQCGQRWCCRRTCLAH